MPRLPIARRLALAFAMLALALACQDGAPSAPSRSGVLPRASSRSWAERSHRLPDRAESTPSPDLPTPVACMHRNVATGSGVFGPAGGILVFGQSRLIIPGGALRDTVTITATTLDDTTSTVNFQPEGLHFYKPAGLNLSSEGCDIPEDGTPRIVYLADDGTILESIPAYHDPHWKSVAAPITHFSGYAIAF